MSVHDDDTEFDSRTSSSFPITPLPISQPKRLTHVFSWNLKQRITTGAVSPNACLDYDYEGKNDGEHFTVTALISNAITNGK